MIFNFNEETGKFTLGHDCDTEKGSSGSPILCLENNKVIAVHFGSFNELKGNLSSLIFPAVNEFLNTDEVITKINREIDELENKIDKGFKMMIPKKNVDKLFVGKK